MTLLLYTLPNGTVLRQYGVLPIYIVIFLTGIARGFIGPAIFSFMPQLVNNKQLYANAVSWTTTTWQGAAMTGPAIGGLLYGFWGITSAYAINLLLMFLATLFFALIKSRPLPATEKRLP